MPIVFHTQQLTGPDRWETVTIDDNPEDAFGSLRDYAVNADVAPWKFRTVMAEQEGTGVKRAIKVEIVRHTIDGFPHFAVSCVTPRCVLTAHFAPRHAASLNLERRWYADVAQVTIDTPYRVQG